MNNSTASKFININLFDHSKISIDFSKKHHMARASTLHGQWPWHGPALGGSLGGPYFVKFLFQLSSCENQACQAIQFLIVQRRECLARPLLMNIPILFLTIRFFSRR
jgi:hypothetical protein